ncbi:MAG: putative OPT family oligopeptide transporter [Chlamydiales bacterium]|jgi:putative OPT family oligopeptide transporter
MTIHPEASATSKPEQDTPREVTVLAVVLGILIGAVMAMANVYLGLFAGMTVSASIPAAVISMGILRGLLKRGTILENNIVQTIASAGESLAAGIIFTMPALVIAGVWTDFDFVVTTLVSITGGMLGVLFMIPLRKPLIVEDENLTYPEGVACAQVLNAGEKGGPGMMLIFGGLAVGALIKLCTDGFSIMAANLTKVITIGKASFFTGLLAAPALIGVGFIVGINIAALVFLGGAISWLMAGPVLTAIDYQAIVSSAPESLTGAVKPHLRMFGVGAMIVGGLWSIYMIRNGIARGLQETMGGYRASMRSEVRPARTETDMEPKWILLMVAATMLIILWLYNHVTGNLGVSVLATVLMTICSFFFVAVAAYIVGLVGSSNSPVSGMTICSVLFTSGFIALFGYQGDLAIIATMGVAGVVCCATCTSGDVCQDLKTGALVGATPKRQQWVEVIGVITSSFVMWFALNLLHKGKGIGTNAHLSQAIQDTTQPLEAPQAQLFANLMNGFFGDSTLPWDLIGVGAGIGILMIVLDQLWLKPRRAKFRLHVMPVAVGMYLPIGLTTAILLGGILAWWAGRRAMSDAARLEGHENGIILASGLIAGEAIAGILIAGLLVGVPAWAKSGMPQLIQSPTLLSALGAGAVLFICGWMIAVSKPRSS